MAKPDDELLSAHGQRDDARAADGLRRNLAIALGNAADQETRAALEDTPDDARPSLGAPVVGAAIARGRRRRDG